MLDYLLSHYFLRQGDDFTKFWKKYLEKKKKILYVMGLGFDPRTLSCFKVMFQNKSDSSLNCMVIKYNDDFPNNKLMANSLQTNTVELENLIPRDKWIVKNIDLDLSSDYSMSVDIVKKIKQTDFQNFTDIVVDISAMPNGISFPLIKTILDWIKVDKIESDQNNINLHVVVSENAKFDGQIDVIGPIDKVTFMFKFSKNLENVSKMPLDKVWIPILGERQSNIFNRINEEIYPKEICPVFPSPSVDPYRAKNLLLEYREFLTDVLDLDTRNFIYSNEQNPFETFRQIYNTAKYNYDVFSKLKGCNIVISPLSSKLLSFGSFLAAYVLLEEKCDVGIAHIENQTYRIDGSIDLDKVKQESTLFTMWLTGDVNE